MSSWRDITDISSRFGASVVTIGVFNGVHQGHQHVVGRIIKAARKRGACSVVCTFHPHPSVILHPTHIRQLSCIQIQPSLLGTLEHRIELLEDLGGDEILVLPFTWDRSRQPPGDLIREIAAALKSIGDHRRRLSVRRQRNRQPRATGISWGASKAWSSTTVRDLLAHGDVAAAGARPLPQRRRCGPVGPRNGYGPLAISPSTRTRSSCRRWLPGLADSSRPPWCHGQPAVISVCTGDAPTHARLVTADRLTHSDVVDRDGRNLDNVPVSVEFHARIRITGSTIIHRDRQSSNPEERAIVMERARASRSLDAMPLLVVMGIAGCGKTVVGAALAQRLDLPFADADDFHAAASIAKMSVGKPLEDHDRLPWLRSVAGWLANHTDTGSVVACSALKRSYRDVLRDIVPQVSFLHLDGNPEIARQRVTRRPGHFMPADLVTSQMATLEPLEPDENGVTLDLGSSVDEIVTTYLRHVDH